MTEPLLVVFIHGWSVTNSNTYGELPQRLVAEAAHIGRSIDVKHVFLGEYISFHDEVQVHDIARAFEAAWQRDLKQLVATFGRFVAITHSTGGPVLREWWQRYHWTNNGSCPMSHLIMLAPANFGSALAQLGQGRLSRMKGLLTGVEPGLGVLDWLEMGSQPAWDLNTRFIDEGARRIGPRGVFPFVLTGQTIDRKLYDHLNAYTGEDGSDGVIRVAAANLNARRLTLSQSAPEQVTSGRKKVVQAPHLHMTDLKKGPTIPLRVVRHASHAGAIGIMNQVTATATSQKWDGRDIVDAILACIAVRTKQDYSQLAKRFERETAEVQAEERVEERQGWFGEDYIHDPHAMLIIKVEDETGRPVDDFDLLLTGNDDDPGEFPRGFFVDRQKNSHYPGTLTIYLNHALLQDTIEEVRDFSGEVLRQRKDGLHQFGMAITPRPDEGFVHFLPCSITASDEAARTIIKSNQTTLIKIVLRRVIYQEVLLLQQQLTGSSFVRRSPQHLL